MTNQSAKGLTVTGLMRQAARYNSKRLAVKHGDRTLTFAEAWDRGTRMANGLLSFGLKPGDRVGVLEDNSIDAQDFFLGAAIAGVVRVPLYARNSIESHEHMLGHTGCRAVVVADKYRSDMDGMTSKLADLQHVVVRDVGYEAWLASFSTDDPMVEIEPDDWYIIRHTGGTTGKPKGVAYSHRSWLAAGRDWFYNFP
ncbi:MAG: AMP-binding protein, partial [Actinomycetota bacterium]